MIRIPGGIMRKTPQSGRFTPALPHYRLSTGGGNATSRSFSSCGVSVSDSATAFSFTCAVEPDSGIAMARPLRTCPPSLGRGPDTAVRHQPRRVHHQRHSLIFPPKTAYATLRILDNRTGHMRRCRSDSQATQGAGPCKRDVCNGTGCRARA